MRETPRGILGTSGRYPPLQQPDRVLTTRESEDLDTYRAANLLLQQYGDSADIHAAERADDLLKAGDMEGATAWVRMLTAIKTILAASQPDASAN